VSPAPPTPEDGKRSSFRNTVVSSFLESQTMDTVQKPISSDYDSPSSEPYFRIPNILLQSVVSNKNLIEIITSPICYILLPSFVPSFHPSNVCISRDRRETRKDYHGSNAMISVCHIGDLQLSIYPSNYLLFDE
jgi:hypothetical protein